VFCLTYTLKSRRYHLLNTLLLWEIKLRLIILHIILSVKVGDSKLLCKPAPYCYSPCLHKSTYTHAQSKTCSIDDVSAVMHERCFFSLLAVRALLLFWGINARSSQNESACELGFVPADLSFQQHGFSHHGWDWTEKLAWLFSFCVCFDGMLRRDVPALINALNAGAMCS